MIDDVRAIALGLPEVFEKINGHTRHPEWRTKRGLVVWIRPASRRDLDQLESEGRAWPEGDVIAISTDGLDDKEALLSEFPDALFTIPHFEGFPAVLAPLATIDRDLLRELVIEAWATRVPRRVSEAWLADHA